MKKTSDQLIVELLRSRLERCKARKAFREALWRCDCSPANYAIASTKAALRRDFYRLANIAGAKLRAVLKRAKELNQCTQ